MSHSVFNRAGLCLLAIAGLLGSGCSALTRSDEFRVKKDTAVEPAADPGQPAAPIPLPPNAGAAAAAPAQGG